MSDHEMDRHRFSSTVITEQSPFLKGIEPQKKIIFISLVPSDIFIHEEKKNKFHVKRNSEIILKYQETQLPVYIFKIICFYRACKYLYHLFD